MPRDALLARPARPPAPTSDKGAAVAQVRTPSRNLPQHHSTNHMNICGCSAKLVHIHIPLSAVGWGLSSPCSINPCFWLFGRRLTHGFAHWKFSEGLQRAGCSSELRMTSSTPCLAVPGLLPSSLNRLKLPLVPSS